MKVGDRVIVMSSTGSRAGMLRFIGETDFAKGVWCGVECDDPVGKNDGAVQGVRSVDLIYFRRRPLFLFREVVYRRLRMHVISVMNYISQPALMN